MDPRPGSPGEAEGADAEQPAADGDRVQADLGGRLAVTLDDRALVDALLDEEVEEVRDKGANEAADEDGATLPLVEAVRLFKDVSDGADEEEDDLMTRSSGQRS